MNAQKFSMIIGISIVVSHIFLTFYFIIFFEAVDGVVLQEMSLPLTAAYVTSIVLWFFKNRGIVRSRKMIGWPLIVLISIIVVSLLSSLFLIPIYFQIDRHMSIESVNMVFLMIETAFGGVFGIVMSELFGGK